MNINITVKRINSQYMYNNSSRSLWVVKIFSRNNNTTRCNKKLLIVSALSAKLHLKLSMCGGQVTGSSSNGNGMSIRSQLKYNLTILINRIEFNWFQVVNNLACGWVGGVYERKGITWMCQLCLFEPFFQLEAWLALNVMHCLHLLVLTNTTNLASQSDKICTVNNCADCILGLMCQTEVVSVAS